MSQEQVYTAAGFGQPVPRGSRPAIVVVDFSYGFTDTQYPTAADMSAEIAATRRLTDRARAMGLPVIYTTIAYQPWERAALPWLMTALLFLMAITYIPDISLALPRLLGMN